MAGREGELLRFKPITQVAHFFLVAGMTILMLTGAAFFFKIGEKQLFADWGKTLGLPTSPPTSQLISVLHDIVGPVLIGIGVVIALAFSVRPKTIKMALPTSEDVRMLIDIIKYRLGMIKERPKVGFYHPLQKLLIWGVVTGLILVGVSGIPMMVEKWFGIRLMSDYVRGVMSLLHLIGAFIFFVMIPIHFLMGLSPANWPILKSMFTFRGTVPLDWWRHHHPGYVEQVLGKQEGGKQEVGGGKG